jgi:hypothetical protein
MEVVGYHNPSCQARYFLFQSSSIEMTRIVAFPEVRLGKF